MLLIFIDSWGLRLAGKIEKTTFFTNKFMFVWWGFLKKIENKNLVFRQFTPFYLLNYNFFIFSKNVNNIHIFNHINTLKIELNYFCVNTLYSENQKIAEREDDISCISKWINHLLSETGQFTLHNCCVTFLGSNHCLPFFGSHCLLSKIRTLYLFSLKQNKYFLI